MVRQLTWSSYFTPPPEMDALGLVCLGVGGQSGAVPAVRERTLDHHAVVLVDAGSGWFRDQRGTRTVSQGSVLRLTPGSPHSYGPGPQGWSESWALMRGRGAGLHQRLGAFDPDPVVTVADVDALLRPLARLRAGRADVGLPADARRSADCYALLLACGSSDRVEDGVLARLLREPEGPASVDEHAHALGMSARELRSLVVLRTGVTPKRLVLRARIDRAKALLAETDLPVSRIAARVGYEDPAYFARLFGRTVGLAPTEFRARYLRPGPTDELDG